MANEFNKEEWMKSLNLTSDEEKKAAELLLGNPERVKEIQRGWNSVSEGSRLAQEAQQAKAAAEAARVAAEQKDLTNKAYFDSLRKWETDALADKDKATAYEAYLKDMGLEPATVLAGNGGLPPARRSAEPAIDPKFLEENKNFQAQTAATAKLLADLNFDLAVASNRHYELFGKMPPADAVMQLKTEFLSAQNQKGFTDLAAEKFHFGDRQKQLDEEALQRRTDELVAEKITKWESEHKLPTGALSAAEVEPAVNMTSDKFASEVKRSSDNDVSRVSDRDMAAFLAADSELAGTGVRMTQ